MKKAFSLAELLVVLAIISIVMGTMKVSIQHKRLQASAKAIVEYFNIYRSAITMYYFRKGGDLSILESNGRKYLEDIPELDLYRPVGFKSHGTLPISELKSIAFFRYDGGGIVVEIWLNNETENYLKLRAEILNQLGNIPINPRDANPYYIEPYIRDDSGNIYL